MDEEPKPYFRLALLSGLQLIAMALCALVLMNMALDEKPPVPQCPVKAEE